MCICHDYYENVLSEISSLCLHHNAEHICIVGDMNTDISRSHSRHTRLLLQFVENEQLYLALNFSNKNVKYTYYNNYHHMHSIIDHFILSQCLFDLIISYHSICEDLSDHSPLCLCLNNNNNNICLKSNIQTSSVDCAPRELTHACSRSDTEACDMCYVFNVNFDGFF